MSSKAVANLIWVPRVNEYLLIFFKPAVHGLKANREQSLEISDEMQGEATRRRLSADVNVIYNLPFRLLYSLRMFLG
jgi:hypothetical protein